MSSMFCIGIEVEKTFRDVLVYGYKKSAPFFTEGVIEETCGTWLQGLVPPASR